MSGQSGYKNQPNQSAFRTEVDYLEIRRADGTFGTDKEFYTSEVRETCPNAQKVYNEDPNIIYHNESAVKDFTQCQPCVGDSCNRVWKKKNLRGKWHEAGRIRYPRLGAISATLKGEAILFGGECGGYQSGAV